MAIVLITIKDFDKRFPDAYAFLQQQGLQVTIRDSLSALTATDYAQSVATAEAIWAGAGCYDKAFLQQAHSLKILARMGSGMDNLDLDYCKEKGIAVANSKGGNANAVAELTLGLMLATMRNIPAMVNAIRQGQWSKRGPGQELRGKTVGLIGAGLIAQRLVQLLQPFQVQLVAYDPYIDLKAAASCQIAPVSMDELLQVSDLISLHLPATKETIGLVDEAFLARMKTGAFLVNCARGSIVKETALYNALVSGKLAGAASDVFCQEPVETDNPLLTLENFVATPHIAGMTTESMRTDSMMVSHSIVERLNGTTPQHGAL